MRGNQEFAELAENYREFRPGYPAEVMCELVRFSEENAQADWPRPGLLIDVGAGTGISTYALASAFGERHRVVGIEPGHAMRQQAVDRAGQSARGTGLGSDTGAASVTFRDGSAEDLGAEDGSAMLVLVAQALQWFDRPAFYREAVRALRPHGVLAVVQNDRDWRGSAFLDAYEAFIERHGDGYSRNYRGFDVAAELDSQPELGTAHDRTHRWVREMDSASFLGMAFSSTKVAAAVRTLGADEAREELGELIAEHFPDGRVRVPYVTRLFARVRRGS